MSASRDADDWEVSPTELLEQAFHLLRTLPAGALAWCMVGPLPFVLGLLFFWSDMSRSGDADISVFSWAVVLALLFAWLKITQGLFARAVWARLLPQDGLPPLRLGDFLRRTAALILLSAFAVPLQFIAVNLLLPFAWVYATFQNAVVFAYTQEFDHRCCRRLLGLSARESHHEPLSNHLLLILLFLFGGMVWGAVFAAGLVVPFLFKILTGVESVFTRNPLAAAFNSLYLAVIVSVAWMVVSPFFRVAYVLRNFHSRSRPTGLDLLSRLHAVRRRASIAAVLMVLLWLPFSARAGDAPSPAETVPTPAESQFDGAIKRSLARREYQWRLAPDQGAAEAKESALQAGIRRCFESIRGVFRDLDRMIGDIIEKLLRGRRLPSSDGSGDAGGVNPSALRGLVYLLGALVVLGLLWFGGRWLLAWQRRPPAAVKAGPVGAPVDLASEETLASQLPEDEWMRLAREQLAAGDARLAVRALFLAILSSLGEQRLIEIGRAKSNLDYRHEVRLRALARREVPELFGQSVGVFERVWYGLHEALPQWVQQLMDTYDHIKRAPSP